MDGATATAGSLGGFEERIGRLRLRLFDVAIGFGFGGNLVAMIANEAVGAATISSRVLGALLALVSLVVWRLRRRRSGVAVDLLLYAVVAVALLIWFDALYLSDDPAYVQLVVVSVSVWLPLSGWIFFLGAKLWRGLLEVVSMVALYTLIGLPQALGPDPAMPPRMLAIVVAAHIGYLVIFLLSRRALLLAADASSAAESLERLANADVLTGLPNRRSLELRLQARLGRNRAASGTGRGRRRGDPRGFGVVLADIDGFKSFNDRFGHDVGDRVLREVAQRLREPLRGEDVIGRWGGEEFLAIVAADSRVEVEAIGRRLVAALADAAGPPVSVCCGAALYRAGDTRDALLRRADTALYAAKAAGPGTLRVDGPPGGPLFEERD